MRHLVFATITGLACGCGAILGLDEYGGASAGPGAGLGGSGGVLSGGAGPGGAGRGGNGGAAGGQGGSVVYAADWSSQLTAVYFFEQASPNLGFDGSGHEHHLSEGTPIPALVMSSPPQGMGAIAIASSTPALSSSDQAFRADTTSSSFTIGAWARTTEDSVDISVVARTNGVNGYALSRDQAIGSPRCWVDQRGTTPTVSSWAANGEWNHVVCRWDIGEFELQLFHDGLATDVADLITPAGAVDGDFEVSPANLPYVGEIDELFFHMDRLSDQVIARIYACGIDGRSCLCDPNDSAAYLDCGRAFDCDGLPSCNHTAL